MSPMMRDARPALGVHSRAAKRAGSATALEGRLTDAVVNCKFQRAASPVWGLTDPHDERGRPQRREPILC